MAIAHFREENGRAGDGDNIAKTSSNGKGKKKI
jgi:hypothetical protein